MSINAESVQHLDPLKYLLDLPRRVLGWCRPEPALQGGAAVVRLRDRGAPLGEQQRIEGVMNAAGERRLVASDRLGDHRAQIPLAQRDQLMLVQPATCKLQQSLPIGGTRELIAKDPHECATSWFAEPVKSQRLTGEPLGAQTASAGVGTSHAAKPDRERRRQTAHRGAARASLARSAGHPRAARSCAESRSVAPARA